MAKMTLDEMLHSHPPRPVRTEVPVREKIPHVVSPVTQEHLGFCKNCGVVSYCLIEGSCPVCDNRTGRGVPILTDAIDALEKVIAWVESLGPENSWSVEEYREPTHIKQTAASLLRAMQGMRDRETND